MSPSRTSWSSAPLAATLSVAPSCAVFGTMRLLSQTVAMTPGTPGTPLRPPARATADGSCQRRLRGRRAGGREPPPLRALLAESPAVLFVLLVAPLAADSPPAAGVAEPFAVPFAVPLAVPFDVVPFVEDAPGVRLTGFAPGRFVG